MCVERAQVSKNCVVFAANTIVLLLLEKVGSGEGKLRVGQIH